MDAARLAAQSDPERNPHFRRCWPESDLPPPPEPFVSLKEAVCRALSKAERRSHQPLTKKAPEK